MTEKADKDLQIAAAQGLSTIARFAKTICPVARSELRVSFLQHCREAGGFRFATLFGARFLEAPMQAHLLQSLFAVQFLLETAERFFHRFALFQFNFSHIRFENFIMFSLFFSPLEPRSSLNRVRNGAQAFYDTKGLHDGQSGV